MSGGAYDEVEIEDMDWNEELQVFTYSCPCGDLFQISLVCGSFSLLRVVLICTMERKAGVPALCLCLYGTKGFVGFPRRSWPPGRK
jgi:CSL zinc finger